MFHRIHQRLGTAGLLIACLALIAALGGTALAASGALTGKQKKEVEKIAKKFAGKPGAAGATGTNGTNGTNGAAGKEGPEGKAGTNGTNGTNGTSVTGVAATVGECPSGGEKYTSVSGSVAVCNGTNGTTGFTETLPPGKTETGLIDQFSYGVPEEAAVKTAISFPIPLATGSANAFVFPEGTTNFGTSGCEGIVAGAPTAPEGTLCVYATNERLNEVSLLGIEEIQGGPGYSPAGTSLHFEAESSPSEAPSIRYEALWAVTASTP